MFFKTSPFLGAAKIDKKINNAVLFAIFAQIFYPYQFPMVFKFHTSGLNVG